MEVAGVMRWGGDGRASTGGSRVDAIVDSVDAKLASEDAGMFWLFILSERERELSDGALVSFYVGIRDECADGCLAAPSTYGR